MAKKIYDLIIIGAGPSALTAAMYAAREGIDLILFEKMTVGGNAAITEMIDNYSGFPDGVTGYELSERMKKQAERFGAIIKFGEVTDINPSGDNLNIVVDDKKILSKSILIATGSSYMKLNVSGEAECCGRGVHYCATCDGAFYLNKKVIVVGGGNSAVQEAIFLTRFAKHVEIVALMELSASGILKDNLNKYIKDKKISVRANTETKEILSKEGKVIGLKVVHDGKTLVLEADGVFVFIGQKPNTQFLSKSGVKLDDNGFVVTNHELETNIPGVYASGDVRSGATMQVASAVGEGATAAISIREYLNKEQLN